MATATARKVDDRDYAILVEMAEENDRSISEELRCIIAEATRKRRVATIVSEMRTFAERNPLNLPNGMTSLDLLREERDSW
jgi:hypothetical protein